MNAVPLGNVCEGPLSDTRAEAWRSTRRGARVVGGRRWWGLRTGAPAHRPGPDRGTLDPHRPRLFALAYHLLGAAGAAEDVVRAAAARWESTDLPTSAAVEARLTADVVNLCRDRLDSERARRTGGWLPEPVPTGHGELGPLDSIEQRELVSLATLTLLEQLSPEERSIFVLREAFGYAHREIADILGLAEAESQRLYRDARHHVHRDRIRAHPSSDRDRVVERFLIAVGAGDRASMRRVLSDDVAVIADDAHSSSNEHSAPVGPAPVAHYLVNLFAAQRPTASISLEEVNGVLAAVVRSGRTVLLVAVPEVVEDRVSAVRVVADPDKLAYFARTSGDARAHMRRDQRK